MDTDELLLECLLRDPRNPQQIMAGDCIGIMSPTSDYVDVCKVKYAGPIRAGTSTVFGIIAEDTYAARLGFDGVSIAPAQPLPEERKTMPYFVKHQGFDWHPDAPQPNGTYWKALRCERVVPLTHEEWEVAQDCFEDC